MLYVSEYCACYTLTVGCSDHDDSLQRIAVHCMLRMLHICNTVIVRLYHSALQRAVQAAARSLMR